MAGDLSAIPPPPTPEQAAAMAAAAQKFYNELWVLLSIGLLITVLRTATRIRNVGLRNLQLDDYLVWIGMTLYGVESGLAYSVGAHARGLANNGMTDAHRAALPTDSEEFRLRKLGSIIQLCGWSTYSTMLWSLKAAWLVFYIRLTEGLGRGYQIRIKIGFAYLLVSWSTVLLNIFLSCRPFHKYWQINPNPGNICHPATSNSIVWVGYFFNVTTDMYLLSIPLPMLWTSRLQKWKKFGLFCLFSGGILVIVFATLRCVLIVTNPIEGAQLAGSWAVRETFVATVTTNLPHVFTLLKGILAPLIGTLSSSGRWTSKYSDGTPKMLRTFGGGGGSGPSWRGRGPPTANPIPDITYNENESEERIVGSNGGDGGHHNKSSSKGSIAMVRSDDGGSKFWAESGGQGGESVMGTGRRGTPPGRAQGQMIHKSVQVEVTRESILPDDIEMQALHKNRSETSSASPQPWAQTAVVGGSSAYAEGPSAERRHYSRHHS